MPLNSPALAQEKRWGSAWVSAWARWSLNRCREASSSTPINHQLLMALLVQNVRHQTLKEESSASIAVAHFRSRLRHALLAIRRSQQALNSALTAAPRLRRKPAANAVRRL